jgi:eukaryotic-like serine/threonine-protein kinase
MTPERWQELKGMFDEALALDPGARGAFLERLRTHDSELSSEVASLLRAHEGPSFLESPLALIGAAAAAGKDPKSWEGRILGAYRVVELVGEGGMGAVYRGARVDGLFDRPVAIKAIRSGLGTEFFLRRFENERRILARPDHPNIAAFLDGGATEESVPYVVMEFVNGTPIDEYCASSRLTVRQRLELFRAVCAAVQYAHQNLIVHRDLKPANILVTAAGQPKLLDFGIAKMLDPGRQDGDGVAPTLMPMMTPEFASPEQVRGEAVTTASDVYSLGVILYLLLAGRLPYRFESRAAPDVVRAICDTEPARPSSVARIAVAGAERKPDTGGPQDRADRRQVHRLRRALRGELDNIMLMALRKEALRRYQSAEQLSNDIGRYLDNLPIMASRDTLGYRSKRFLIRHRAGVGAALIVIAALLGGIVTTWREARIAQRRFDDVRSLANSLIFDIHDAIQDLPGSTAARKLVVERATEYLDKLTLESRGDASLLREVAAGYQRIGDAQGNSLAANLGDTSGALASYRQALALRQTLFNAYPKNAADAVALAKVLRLVAHAELVSGDTANAWQHSQLAVSIAETATRMQPRDVPVLQELREDYASEAGILGGNTNLSNLGDTMSALAVRQRELAVAQRIDALEADSTAAQEILARSVAHMGDQLALVGRRRESLAQYLRARQMFGELARQKPGANAQSSLQAIYGRVFFAQYSSGAKADALASIRRAMESARAGLPA